MTLPTRNRWTLLAIISIAVVTMMLLRYAVMPRDESQSSIVTSIDAEYRADFIRALAGAESSDFEVALRLWYDLLEKNPQDQRVKFNYAVTAVADIQDASQQIVSRPLQPKEIEKLRIALDATQVIANRYMADLKVEAFEPSKLAFLESQLYQAAASLEKSPEKSDKWYRDAVNSITAAMANDPASPLLACELDELVSSMSDDEELDRKAAAALFAAWSDQPRNLYLTTLCGERLLKEKDARLAQLLKQSLEVAKPFESMLKSLVKEPINFEETVGACITSVEAKDWSEPRRVRLWLNMLKGCSSMTSDIKQVRPSVLSLLDTTVLSDLAVVGTQEVDTKGASQALIPKYEVSKLTALEGATAIAWYDHDVDTDFELVVAAKDQLVMLQRNNSLGFDQLASLAVDITVQGMVVADLFEANSQQRPRIVRKVPDLMNMTPEERKKYDYLTYRHDTFQELVVWGPSGIRIIGSKIGEDGTPQLFFVREPTGLEALTDIRCAEVADIESDSDLDLIVNTSSGFRILQNNGNRNFRDITEYSTLPETASSSKRLVACDFDRDMDQDFVTLSADGRRLAVLENIRHSQFRYREFGAEASSARFSDFDFGDIDGNRSWDWVSVGDQDGQITTMRQPEPAGLSVLSTNRVAATGSLLALGDLNNDSHLDLVAGGAKGLTMCLGDASAPFGNVRQLLPGTVTALALIDSDQDGGLDIASIVDGQVSVMLSKETVNRFVSARVRGFNDSNGRGRINHYAIGSTIELASDDRIQSLTLRNPVVHFGLGDSDPLNLRIIFENGLIQNSAITNTNVLIEERQELASSCPFVYGWNGEKFELITDCLWNSPLGLQVARGQVMQDRRWEHLLLPEELMQAKDGGYELRFTEELWEIVYLDHLCLKAIDHPEGTNVYTNEKVGPANIATPQLFVIDDRIRPVLAVDGYGRDVLPQVVAQDKIYAKAFKHLVCQGLAEPHFVEFDFGSLPIDKPLRLFLTGWVYPTDTSLNIGLDQNPELSMPEPPSLWVVGEDGRWQCAQPFTGFPGGKPKSIVIDLKGVFPTSDHRVRIASSQQIYWDETFVASEQTPRDLNEQELKLSSAKLTYHGFSQLLPRTADEPHWYDYQDVSADQRWPKLAGPFTRFGAVEELLAADDDQMIVMAPGDEVVLRFNLPPKELPTGWRRDFVLTSVGWEKDGDINTVTGDGSLPLPFKAQTSYPPPPEQFEEAKAVLEKNAATLTRQR